VSSDSIISEAKIIEVKADQVSQAGINLVNNAGHITVDSAFQ